MGSVSLEVQNISVSFCQLPTTLIALPLQLNPNTGTQRVTPLPTPEEGVIKYFLFYRTKTLFLTPEKLETQTTLQT